MKFEPWDEFKGIEDLDSTLREGKRKEFTSRLGQAEPVFCTSCAKPNGFVSYGSPYVGMCRDCEEKYKSLPLPETPNVMVFCKSCSMNPVSIPRELVDITVWYCEPCEIKMGGKPPLEPVI